jgi:predicted DNA-binding WGR domain protein
MSGQSEQHSVQAEAEAPQGARLYLERREPHANRARFYSLHLAPTLFGGCDLIREWGRIGSPGTVQRDPFETEAEAQQALQRIAQQKRRRGYQ